ncbi:hypothetical protein ACWD5F_14845 [Streptomyces sp. NPDC002499]
MLDGTALGVPLDVPVSLLAAVVGHAAVRALALDALPDASLDALSPPEEQAARLSHTATVAAMAAPPLHGPVRELFHEPCPEPLPEPFPEPGRDFPAFRACCCAVPLFSSISLLLADTKP